MPSAGLNIDFFLLFLSSHELVYRCANILQCYALCRTTNLSLIFSFQILGSYTQYVSKGVPKFGGRLFKCVGSCRMRFDLCKCADPFKFLLNTLGTPI